MRVKVQAEFARSSRQRLTFFDPATKRRVAECVRADDWNRKAATEALDLLQYVYKVNRGNVRFDVR